VEKIVQVSTNKTGRGCGSKETEFATVVDNEVSSVTVIGILAVFLSARSEQAVIVQPPYHWIGKGHHLKGEGTEGLDSV
jgi:hypothetical protein